MSTNDVPGARAVNQDELSMGCWAEHEDGSLIFVEGVEGGDVVYSMFDMSKEPAVEYRDVMTQDDFERQFTWDGKVDQPKPKAFIRGKGKPKKDKKTKTVDVVTSIRWTWHDKTPFPWDRVIGDMAAARHPTARDLLTAAERVAESRDLHGSRLDPERFEAVAKSMGPRGKRLLDAIQEAILDLAPGA